MPQNAPFVSAAFGPVAASLELRLAKLTFSLQWKLASEASSIKAAPEPEAKSVPVEAKPIKKKEKTSISNAAKGSARVLPLLSEEAAFLLILLVGLVVGALAFAALLPIWSFLADVPIVLLSLGGAQDIWVLYLAQLPLHLTVLAVAIVLVLFLSRRVLNQRKIWRVTAPRWIEMLLPLLKLMPRRPGWARLGAVAFASILATWPLGIAFLHGARLRDFGPASRLAKLHQKLESQELNEKTIIVAGVEALQQAALDSPGSSIAYRDWYRLQKRRTLLECNGVGDKEWGAKRFCLILLYGVALEGFTRFRPALLGESAALNVLLSSLDGMTRVLASEGTQSKNVALFLESLQVVGLDRERKDLLEFISGYQGMQLSALLEGLIRLRLRIETRISRQQKSYGRHPELQLDLAGPLELGI